MNQEFKLKTAQNSKNLRLNGHTSFEFQTMVIQVLNSKLGITLRVSVTSATILTANQSWIDDLMRISFGEVQTDIDSWYQSFKPAKGRGCRKMCSLCVEETKSGAKSTKLT